MKRAQGTIEYLLIIAVVLIITVLVVLFLTNIFGQTSDDAQFSACRTAASTCNKNKAIYGEFYDCKADCESACITSESFDVMLKRPTFCVAPGEKNFDGSACGYCSVGDLANIVPKK